MTLRDGIEVEPLSEERWNRIEGAVFAELDAPASSHPPARRSRRAAVLVLAAASVAVAAAAAAIFVLVVNEEIHPPMHVSRIVTGDDGTRAVVGDVSLEVAGATALSVVGSDADGWIVTLEQGRASFAVPPRDARPPFVVHAAEVRVEVIGTRFTVSRRAEAVTVEVEEGVVRVTRRGRAIMLGAGESWPEAEEPGPEAPLAGEAGETAPADPPAERPAAEAGLSTRALFDRAQHLEASDTDRAIALYARAARRSGPWAENALYAQARLELDRGRRDASMRLLRRYLERHPDGMNANDARTLLDRMEGSR